LEGMKGSSMIAEEISLMTGEMINISTGEMIITITDGTTETINITTVIMTIGIVIMKRHLALRLVDSSMRWTMTGRLGET